MVFFSMSMMNYTCSREKMGRPFSANVLLNYDDDDDDDSLFHS